MRPSGEEQAPRRAVEGSEVLGRTASGAPDEASSRAGAATGGTAPSADDSGLVVRLTPRAVGRFLALMILLLTVIHSMNELLFLKFDTPFIFGLRPLFNLDREANIPTFYSGIQLLLAGLITIGIAITTKRRGLGHHRQWWALGLVLTFMAVDEVGQIHEKVGALMYRIPRATDALGGRAWVLVGLVLVVMVGIYFIPFLIRLPSSTRWGFILAGGIFVFGAVGMEVVEALWQRGGGNVPGYILIATVQEVLEMVGIAYFIVVALRHAASIGMHLVIRVASEATSDP